MKNGELYDSPFFSFSGGRIRSGGLCTCLPSTLSACIGLCLPSALFVCVCLCLCQVCLSAAPCLRVCLRWLSVCLFAVCLCLCQVCLSAAPCLRVCLPSALSACGGLSFVLFLCRERYALRVAAAGTVGGDDFDLAGRCRRAGLEVEVRRTRPLRLGYRLPGGL